jgi:hypothetical protein
MKEPSEPAVQDEAKVDLITESIKLVIIDLPYSNQVDE